MPRPKQDQPGLQLAVVEWVDANSEEGPLSPEQASPLMTLFTAGWLMLETEGYVSIAQDWCQDDERFRKVIHIPRKGVRRIRRINQ